MRRVWIIGNGASLASVNMDLLIGEDCIATNKIHLIYPTTNWRPTHYCKVDHVPGENWREQIDPHIDNGEVCLLWDAFGYGADPEDGNYEDISRGIGNFFGVIYIPRCEHTNLATGAWHLPKICTGQNSVLPMIQWAVTLGYDEIFLLGCDGKYEKGKDHFVNNYYTKWDDTYEARCNQKTREAHEIAKSGCSVPVYNCTVGSVITVWPTRRMEDVLG
jgi:hypothetical protein